MPTARPCDRVKDHVRVQDDPLFVSWHVSRPREGLPLYGKRGPHYHLVKWNMAGGADKPYQVVKLNKQRRFVGKIIWMNNDLQQYASRLTHMR